MYLILLFLSFGFFCTDGLVFLGHHIFTCLLSLFALNPFLHHYAAFFLGMSEFSTSILCLYLVFDKETGGEALIRRFPLTHTILGIAFALSFITFRVILWFYFTYFFWIDLLAVLHHDLLHSYPAVIFYLFGSFCLSILQLKWLGDILAGVRDMFFPSKKNGADAKKTD